VRPEVSIAIFDSSVPIDAGQCVYMSAVARELAGDDCAEPLDIFSRRVPVTVEQRTAMEWCWWSPSAPEDLHGSHTGLAWVYVAVDDPDAHYERAKAAGVDVLNEPHDALGGTQRGYSARDLEGNLWSFGTAGPEATI
jgi:hypothetical protein